MDRRGLASGSNDVVEGSSFWCIFFHTSCRQWVLVVVSEICCGHRRRRRRRDSKFSVGCENRRHRLGLGLFLWSSEEDWMQKKDRNQRRPGRRRAEDVARVTVSVHYFFIFQSILGELHTAIGNSKIERRARLPESSRTGPGGVATPFGNHSKEREGHQSSRPPRRPR